MAGGDQERRGWQACSFWQRKSATVPSVDYRQYVLHLLTDGDQE
jgi:hypothetical protein